MWKTIGCQSYSCIFCSIFISFSNSELITFSLSHVVFSPITYFKPKSAQATFAATSIYLKCPYSTGDRSLTFLCVVQAKGTMVVTTFDVLVNKTRIGRSTTSNIDSSPVPDLVVSIYWWRNNLHAAFILHITSLTIFGGWQCPMHLRLNCEFCLSRKMKNPDLSTV